MNIEDIKELIYSYKKENRKITNDTYINKIYKVLELGIPIEEFENIRDSLLKTYTKKSVKSYMTAVVVYLKAKGISDSIVKKYSEYVKLLGDSIEKDYKKNEATEKEIKNIVKKQEIEKIIQNLEVLIDKSGSNKFKVYQKYLVIHLYYLIPPLRNDYINTEVYEAEPLLSIFIDNEKNYIYLQSKKLILNRYKTKKKYGTIEIQIPDKIIEIIKTLFVIREELYPELKGNKQLLINEDLKPMTQVNLTHLLNRIFNRNVSTTMLRKSYISEKYPVQFTIEDMEKDARNMGHSVGVQQKIYRKRL